MGYDFDAIQKNYPSHSIIGKYIKLKKEGNTHRGLCPFHTEKTPSFHVYNDGGWNCFGCPANGAGVLSFIAQHDCVTYPEALEKLGGGDFVITERERRDMDRLDREMDKDRQKAIVEANSRWEAASPATDENAYIDRKMIRPHMAREEKGALLVPVYDTDGNIQNVQTIYKDGKKLFQWGPYTDKVDDEGKRIRGAGAPAKGGRLNFGICIGRSIVCEGFATGASIYEAVPDRVAVGFSKTGCIDLIRELHGKGQDVAIASDRNALPAMLKLGEELGIPVYAPPEPYDDFNDMSVAMYEGDATEEEVFAAVRAILDGEPINNLKDKPEPKPKLDHVNDDDQSGPVDIWAKPMPPQFPIGVFPAPIEAMAVHRGDQAGCDPSGIAVAALVACAGTLSDTIRIKMRVHEPWFERPCLWGMLIGVPSTNKSAMLKCAASKVKAIDSGMHANNLRKLADWQEDGGTKGGEAVPALPRLRIEDITMESAQEVCRYSPDGVISFQNELTGFFGGIEKHSGKGGGLDRSFWINAYDGGQYAVNRIGRGGMAGYIIDNLSVSILGGIQPDPIKRIMSGYSDDGIIQRFLPIVLRDGIDGEDKPAPDVGSEFDGLVECLHEMRLKGDAYFMRDYLEFSEEAQQVQYRTSKFHNKLVKSFEEINPTMSSHFGKYNGFFGRLCITMHCIENVNNLSGVPRFISLETAERVEVILDKFIMAHSVAFYSGMLGLSEDIARVKAVGGYILAHKLETVTMRTIGRNVSAMKKIDRQEAAKVFEQLEAFGWLEQVNKRSDAPSWDVNPEVHIRFAEKAISEVERRAEVRDIIAEMVEQARKSA